MNNKNINRNKLADKSSGNPFSVPDNYFSNFSSRLQERIKMEEEIAYIPSKSIWQSVKPHLALAAAILGFALISFTTLQLIFGENQNYDYYDMALMDKTGITLDELVFQETFAYSEIGEEDSYSEWEEDAMIYLASNEVNLDMLLIEN